MRILHALHGFPPEFAGGTERYVDRLAREQAAAGHDVRLLTGSGTAGPRPWLDLLVREGLPHYRLHRVGIHLDLWTKSEAPEADPWLTRLLRTLRPAVLHLHHWLRLSRTLVRRAARLGVPAVVTLHDLAATCPRGFRLRPDGRFCTDPASPRVCLGCAPAYPWQDPAELTLELRRFRRDLRLELAAAARLVVPSRAQAELLARVTGLPVERFLVLPPGDLETVPSPPRDWRPAPAGRLRLVHWGHFREEKGVHLLVEALRRLPPPLRARLPVTLYGAHVFPRYEERLRALARGLPVRFAGPYEPADLARESYDVAVFPTLCYESYAFVLDEAFRLGLPVVVSDRGALPERAGEGGWTFRAGDAADLARVLRGLLRRPEVVAERRRRLPPPQPPMARHAAALLALYGEVVRTGPPRPPPLRDAPLDRLRRAFVEGADLRATELRGRLGEEPDPLAAP